MNVPFFICYSKSRLSKLRLFWEQRETCRRFDKRSVSLFLLLTFTSTMIYYYLESSRQQEQALSSAVLNCIMSLFLQLLSSLLLSMLGFFGKKRVQARRYTNYYVISIVPDERKDLSLFLFFKVILISNTIDVAMRQSLFNLYADINTFPY